MKKFLSLVLAAMLLMSCTAFAATHDSIINGNNSAWYDADQPSTDTDGDADIDVREESVRYGDTDGFDTEGQAATELWLQVDATGQIDVTVPLVLIFQTNIDGGEATSPSAYKITNHSSADLAVTKIATTLVATQVDEDVANYQPMTMVAYTATPAEDQYKAQITVGNVDTGVQAKLGKDETGVYDLYEGIEDTATGATTAHTKTALQGGLFELEKAKSTGAGTVTNLAVDMTTGRLSFVTSRKLDNGKDVMDQDKGIQLLTITYTVAINTSDAMGEAITTEETAQLNNEILTGADSDKIADGHTKIVEETISGATKNNEDANTPAQP